jgi:hypothetical protein
VQFSVAALRKDTMPKFMKTTEEEFKESLQPGFVAFKNIIDGLTSGLNISVHGINYDYFYFEAHLHHKNWVYYCLPGILRGRKICEVKMEYSRTSRKIFDISVLSAYPYFHVYLSDPDPIGETREYIKSIMFSKGMKIREKEIADTWM